MTTSPGTSILRDKLNIVVYTSGLCAWPKLLTDHGLIFLEQGKKGSTDCQPLEDQPWAPRTLLSAPPLFIHGSLISQALLFYTNALTENDAKLQQAACVALKHLRVSLTCPLW